MSEAQVRSLLSTLNSCVDENLRAKVDALLCDINSLAHDPDLQHTDNPGTPDSATGEQTVQIKARLGQDAFSENVRQNYGHQCCFPQCPIAEDILLVGAHIARWSDATHLQGKTSNGLCLCLFHDKAFEIGLFTLTRDFRIAANPSWISRSPWAKRHIAPFEEQRIRLGPIKPARESLREHWQRIAFVPKSRKNSPSPATHF